MRRLIAVAAFAALLGGCAAPRPPAPPAAAPAPAISAPYQAGARAGEPVYRLDPAASKVQVLVGRAGPLADAGHVHVIEVAALEGYALTENGAGRADLVFSLAAMVVDPPAARAALGGAWAEPLTDSQRAATRTNMLGPQALDAARYPWVHLAIAVPAAASGTTPIRVTLTLHGVTRSFPATTALALDTGHLLASGTFGLRQSDFGIRPYTALLGALRVADTLDIRYHLSFKRWCPAPAPSSC